MLVTLCGCVGTILQGTIPFLKAGYFSMGLTWTHVNHGRGEQRAICRLVIGENLSESNHPR